MDRYITAISCTLHSAPCQMGNSESDPYPAVACADLGHRPGAFSGRSALVPCSAGSPAEVGICPWGEEACPVENRTGGEILRQMAGGHRTWRRRAPDCGPIVRSPGASYTAGHLRWTATGTETQGHHVYRFPGNAEGLSRHVYASLRRPCPARSWIDARSPLVPELPSIVVWPCGCVVKWVASHRPRVPPSADASTCVPFVAGIEMRAPDQLLVGAWICAPLALETSAHALSLPFGGAWTCAPSTLRHQRLFGAGTWGRLSNAWIFWPLRAPGPTSALGRKPTECTRAVDPPTKQHNIQPTVVISTKCGIHHAHNVDAQRAA